MCFFHVIILFNFSSAEGSKQIWEGSTLLKGGSNIKHLYVWFQIPAIKNKGFWQRQLRQKPLFLPFLGVFTTSNCIN